MSFNQNALINYIIDIGEVKINKNTKYLILKGILAGILISLGAIAYFKIISIAHDTGLGEFFAAAVFPTGLIGILLLGGELFTSNCMTLTGVYKNKYKLIKVIKMLLIVLLANWIGTIIVSLLATGAGIFTDKMMQLVISVAEKKTSIPFTQMLLSSVLCNIIVCSGVMMAYSAETTTSKIIAVWFPIAVFVLSGTEHIVANMFFITMGYLNGGSFTLSDMLYSHSVVTLGNFIGGAILISGLNALVYSDNEV